MGASAFIRTRCFETLLKSLFQILLSFFSEVAAVIAKKGVFFLERDIHDN